MTRRKEAQPVFRYHPTASANLMLGAVHRACFKLAPDAKVEHGCPMYYPIRDAVMAAFLKGTSVDRHIWRRAQPDKAKPQFVCTSFSLLFWALVEQERLRCRCIYPLAIARVRIAYDDPKREGHSMNGYINEREQFRLVEPQTDAVTDALPPELQGARIIKIEFL